MSKLVLDLYRKFRGESYCIGDLSVDGKFFCNTIEDKDRGLNHQPGAECSGNKIPKLTCIPYGLYRVTINQVSPKFSSKPNYNWCNGKLPRLIDVPHFSGILIHAGNTEKSSAGCIIVGKNTIKGMVTESMDTLKKLYKILSDADKSGKELWINIHK